MLRKLTDAAVGALAEHCPGLISVYQPICRNLAAAAVVALTEHCPGFFWVGLAGCGKLADEMRQRRWS